MLAVCFIVLLKCICVLSQSVLDFASFQYMLDNSLFHNRLIDANIHIPHDPITAMRYNDDTLYFATQNGLLYIETIHNNETAIYPLDPHLYTDASIIDILPIHGTNSVALLILQEANRYAVSVVHVWSEFVTRVFIKEFDNPVCITNSVSGLNELVIITQNSIISVNYVGDETIHLFNDYTLASQPMSCVAIHNDIFTGYMIHIDDACFVAYLIDRDFNINTFGLQIIATHQSNQSITNMIDSSTPILVPTMFGYITTSCLFDINFHDYNLSLSQTRANSFDLSNILHVFNISAESVQVSDIQQTGYQLTFLFVTHEKELHVIYGNIPYGVDASTEQPVVNSIARRLLILADDTKRGQYKSNVPYLSIPPPRIATPRTQKPLKRCDAYSTLQVSTLCLINGIQYFIQKRLGSGSHGSVYKALMNCNAPKQVKTVAIKSMQGKDEFLMENGMLRALRGVTGAIQRVDSAKPTIHSVKYLIVMDYISGGDVYDFMTKPPIRFTTNQTINIVKSFLLNVANPMSYINEKVQWIYADLKPENVLVEFSHSKTQFFLADFSCVLAIEEFQDKDALAGTPLWLSPEMASKCYLGVTRFPSLMCIDAYGLELVAIHLYGALCQIPSNVPGSDILCNTARSFDTIHKQLGDSYSRGRQISSAFNTAFKERSASISKAFRLLKLDESLKSNALIQRQIALLEVFATHLVRVPSVAPNKHLQWIHSSPAQCVSWRQWLNAVQMI